MSQRITVSAADLKLMLEGIDMLTIDYEQGEIQHPELKAMERLAAKLRRVLAKEEKP